MRGLPPPRPKRPPLYEGHLTQTEAMAPPGPPAHPPPDEAGVATGDDTAGAPADAATGAGPGEYAPAGAALADIEEGDVAGGANGAGPAPKPAPKPREKSVGGDEGGADPQLPEKKPVGVNSCGKPPPPPGIPPPKTATAWDSATPRPPPPGIPPPRPPPPGGDGRPPPLPPPLNGKGPGACCCYPSPRDDCPVLDSEQGPEYRLLPSDCQRDLPAPGWTGGCSPGGPPP